MAYNFSGIYIGGREGKKIGKERGRGKIGKERKGNMAMFKGVAML